MPPRWKRCTNDVDGDLGEALGQAYVGKHFSPSKTGCAEDCERSEAAMQSEIQTLPWMSGGDQGTGVIKLARHRQQDCYPDAWRDYSALEIVRGDEIGNSQCIMV